MAAIQPGERIRLVSLNATLSDGTETRISLRYHWDRPNPSHSCVADDCDFCDERAVSIIERRFGPGAELKRVRLLRDRQAVAR